MYETDTAISKNGQYHHRARMVNELLDLDSTVISGHFNMV